MTNQTISVRIMNESNSKNVEKFLNDFWRNSTKKPRFL
jgi:hypothetical protein